MCVHLCDAGCGCGVKEKMCVIVSVEVLPLSHPQPTLLPEICVSFPSSVPAPLLLSLPAGGRVRGELVLPPPLPIPAP